MPPALVLCAYILAFHRGRPVALRLCCALALPLALSVMLHGLLSQVLPWDAALIKTLWATGEELKSGGALGGLLGQVFVSLFTKLGCTIVCVLCGFFLALDACNRSIVDVAEWLFNRPQYEYEPERPRRRREMQEEQETPAHAAPASSLSRRAEMDIDIPVDDGPLVGQSCWPDIWAGARPRQSLSPTCDPSRGPPSSHLRTWLPWTSPSLSPPRS